MVVQIVDDLPHHVPLVGGLELISALRGGRRCRLFPVKKQDHLGDVGLQHEIASRLASLALRLNQGTEAGEKNKGFLTGVKQQLPSRKTDLVAFHSPELNIGEGNIEFHKRSGRRAVCTLVNGSGIE